MACTPQLVVVRTPALGPGMARSGLGPRANDVTDWDSAYRQEGVFEGPPLWNIAEPQPELAALVAGASGRGLHRSGRQLHPDGYRGRHQGRRGTRLEQR
jgi:hypothetical protein